MPVVAVPLAAPLAGAIGKGVAQGIGAALKYGPLLLQLEDNFQNPGRLGGSVADTPRGQRLRELIQDAVNGARVPVAQPPAPGFPPPSPLGPLGPLNPGDQAARALVERLGQARQDWGGPNGREPEGVAEPPADEQFSVSRPVVASISWVRTYIGTSCGSGEEATDNLSGSGSGTAELFPGESYRIVGNSSSLVSSPCGSAFPQGGGGQTIFRLISEGLIEQLLPNGGYFRFFPAELSEVITVETSLTFS